MLGWVGCGDTDMHALAPAGCWSTRGAQSLASTARRNWVISNHTRNNQSSRLIHRRWFISLPPRKGRSKGALTPSNPKQVGIPATSLLPFSYIWVNAVLSGQVERIIREKKTSKDIHLNISVSIHRDETPYWLSLCCEYRVIAGASVYFPSHLSGTNANVYRKIRNRQQKKLAGRSWTPSLCYNLQSLDTRVQTSTPSTAVKFNVFFHLRIDRKAIFQRWSVIVCKYATLSDSSKPPRFVSLRLPASKYVPKFPLSTHLANQEPSSSWFWFAITAT